MHESTKCGEEMEARGIQLEENRTMQEKVDDAVEGEREELFDDV